MWGRSVQEMFEQLHEDTERVQLPNDDAALSGDHEPDYDTAIAQTPHASSGNDGEGPGDASPGKQSELSRMERELGMAQSTTRELDEQELIPDYGRGDLGGQVQTGEGGIQKLDAQASGAQSTQVPAPDLMSQLGVLLQSTLQSNLLPMLDEVRMTQATVLSRLDKLESEQRLSAAGSEDPRERRAKSPGSSQRSVGPMRRPGSSHREVEAVGDHLAGMKLESGMAETAVMKHEHSETGLLGVQSRFSDRGTGQALQSEFSMLAIAGDEVAKEGNHVTLHMTWMNSGKTGLLDSGASTCLRRLVRDEDETLLVSRTVELATGTAEMLVNPFGTLLAREDVECIVALKPLISMGCKWEWSEDKCVLHHPHRGDIKLDTSSGCPRMPESLALKLIQDAEEAVKQKVVFALRAVQILQESSHLEVDEVLGKLVVAIHTGVEVAAHLGATARAMWPNLDEDLVQDLQRWPRQDSNAVMWNRRKRRAVVKTGGVLIQIGKCKEERAIKQYGAALGWEILQVTEQLTDPHDFRYLLEVVTSGKVRGIIAGDCGEAETLTALYTTLLMQINHVVEGECPEVKPFSILVGPMAHGLQKCCDQAGFRQASSVESWRRGVELLARRAACISKMKPFDMTEHVRAGHWPPHNDISQKRRYGLVAVLTVPVDKQGKPVLGDKQEQDQAKEGDKDYGPELLPPGGIWDDVEWVEEMLVDKEGAQAEQACEQDQPEGEHAREMSDQGFEGEIELEVDASGEEDAKVRDGGSPVSGPLSPADEADDDEGMKLQLEVGEPETEGEDPEHEHAHGGENDSEADDCNEDLGKCEQYVRQLDEAQLRLSSFAEDRLAAWISSEPRDLGEGESDSEGEEMKQMRELWERIGNIQHELKSLTHETLGEIRERVGVEEAPSEGEVFQTRVVGLAEALARWEVWEGPAQDELNSLILEKGALVNVSWADVRKWRERGVRVTILPSKLVFSIKAPNARHKVRVVACGNMGPPRDESKHEYKESVFTSSLDITHLRSALAFSAKRGQEVATVDVRTAFLNADLLPRSRQLAEKLAESGESCEGQGDIRDSVQELVVLTPPRSLVQRGLVRPSTLWRVDKAMYGLDTSPRDWGLHRNSALRDLRIIVGDRELRLWQSFADENLWLISETEPIQDWCGPQDWTPLGLPAKILGWVGVYIDDMIIGGDKAVVQGVLDAVTARWKCGTPEWVGHESSRPLRFLGLDLHWGEGRNLHITQTAYIKELGARYQEQLSRVKASNCPMAPGTGEIDEEPEKEISDIRKGQKILGELLWTAVRSRPDISFAVSKLSQWITKAPRKVYDLALQTLAYLCDVPDVGLVYEAGEPEKPHPWQRTLKERWSMNFYEIFHVDGVHNGEPQDGAIDWGVFSVIVIGVVDAVSDEERETEPAPNRTAFGQPRSPLMTQYADDAIAVLDRAEVAFEANQRRMLGLPPYPLVVINPAWGPAPNQPTVRELRRGQASWGGIASSLHHRPPATERRDSYQLDQARWVLIRWHVRGRVRLFDPTSTRIPIDIRCLSGRRRTLIIKNTDEREIVDDNFRDQAQRYLQSEWVGRTEFEVLPDLYRAFVRDPAEVD
ncbi:RE1 [Symbiodinium sp. CCMP2592]|nr:RE1 [Symbiodinium sp. CCMP2592]